MLYVLSCALYHDESDGGDDPDCSEIYAGNKKMMSDFKRFENQSCSRRIILRIQTAVLETSEEITIRKTSYALSGSTVSGPQISV